MNIGIPKERRPSEFRVGLSPLGVELLTQAGHTCYVEQDAGRGAGFSDQNYMDSGAQIVYSGEEVYGRSDLVLKVSRPTIEEMDWLVEGQALMGLLQLPAAQVAKIHTLLEKKITAIAYEQIQRKDGSLPVLHPLSQIGGQMAAQIAARLLQNDNGGKGILLGGVPGVPPAEVVIIGGGVVGENAARTFLGMGAQVTLLDQDLERLQTLSKSFSGRVVTLVAHPFNVERVCRYADVLVGAVHVSGERAPLVISRKFVQSMKKGALLIDMSIDEGGCSETSRPTSHKDPTFIDEGVVHCCIPNIPGVVARTSTHAFLNAAWPFIHELANNGIDKTLKTNRALARGLATYQGTVHNLRHPMLKKNGDNYGLV